MKKVLLSIAGVLSLLNTYSQTLQARAGNDQPLCDNDWMYLGAQPAVSGGTPPYTYQWDLVGWMTNFSNLSNPMTPALSVGTYTFVLTVMDSLGNAASDDVVITVIPNPTADAGPDVTVCRGVCATLGGSPTGTGGTGPYSYFWTPLSNLNVTTLSNPTACVQSTRTYTVNVVDSNGCSATDNVTIIVLPKPNATISTTSNTPCEGSLVQFTDTVFGGTPPFVRLWDFNDGTTSTLQNPTHTFTNSGIYQVRLYLTDVNGCLDTAYMSLNILQSCVFGFTVQNAPCFGLCNGSATVNPAGNYQYLWSNAATTRTVTNLCAGTYSVTVSDSLSSPLDTLSVTINQPNPIVVNVSTGDVSCFGFNNGFATLTVTGGTPPFIYAWSNGSTGPIQQNLGAGNYFVSVIDNSQCVATATFTINQPAGLMPTALFTPESIVGACDGAVDLTVTGGTSPYVYAWSNNDNTEDIDSLCPGTYNVTISDANNCTITVVGIVNAACPNNTIVLSLTSTGDLDCTTLFDTLDAVVSGGTPPYTYLWSNFSTTQSIVVNQAGIYTFWVTDSQGCTRSANDTVQNFGVVVTLQSATPVTCNGSPDGNIKVSVTGGTPPYTFMWSNGATTDSIANLASGTYNLTVSDAASCVVSFSYFLNQQSTNWSYYLYVSSTPANCANNGTAAATVFGGTGPFTYLWNTTPPQTTAIATGLSAGTYEVTVSGSDGCFRTGTAHVLTSCYNVVQGFLFIDANNNCVKDSGETTHTGAVVATGTGGTYYGSANVNGFYSINIPSSGAYTISTNPNFGWGSCTTASVCPQSVTFSGLGDSTTADLGIGPSTGFNLGIHPGWTSANPGFTKDYWILFRQYSQPYYTGPGVVSMTYDTMLQFDSCTNGCVHDAANHTVLWNIDSMPSAWAQWGQRHFVTFQVPVNTPVNYQLHTSFLITPTVGDCQTSNNALSTIEPVTGSRDPNAKEVLPAGDIVEEDSMLVYTIHFQNTGNDTTWFVILKDTLSAHVNPATVQNISSSHEYASFDISDNGILTWVFNPIYLVDSATNEPASKGYVMFRVKKDNNLPLTTEIKNKASIYFDYNEPIVTNTVTNTITFPNYIFTIKSDENISVSAMPNPFSKSTQIVVEGISGAFDFEMVDVTGKAVKKISSISNNSFSIDRENMSAGVYFYRITSLAKQRAFGKVVVE